MSPRGFAATSSVASCRLFIAGAFHIYAGWFVEKVEASGFGDIFGGLEAEPSGGWILIALATGLTAYGLYQLLTAWYLRLIAAW